MCIYGVRDSKKTRQIQNKGWKEGLDAREIVKLSVEDEGGNGDVPRDNEELSARKRAGKEGKKGRGRCWRVEK